MTQGATLTQQAGTHPVGPAPARSESYAFQSFLPQACVPQPVHIHRPERGTNKVAVAVVVGAVTTGLFLLAVIFYVVLTSAAAGA